MVAYKLKMLASVTGCTVVIETERTLLSFCTRNFKRKRILPARLKALTLDCYRKLVMPLAAYTYLKLQKNRKSKICVFVERNRAITRFKFCLIGYIQPKFYLLFASYINFEFHSNGFVQVNKLNSLIHPHSKISLYSRGLLDLLKF